MIVSVGFLSAFDAKGAPSVTKRLSTSHVWHHALVTDVFASAPMIAPPTSWMMEPPGAMAFLQPQPTLEISTGATARTTGDYAYNISGVDPERDLL